MSLAEEFKVQGCTLMKVLFFVCFYFIRSRFFLSCIPLLVYIHINGHRLLFLYTTINIEQFSRIQTMRCIHFHTDSVLTLRFIAVGRGCMSLLITFRISADILRAFLWSNYSSSFMQRHLIDVGEGAFLSIHNVRVISDTSA